MAKRIVQPPLKFSDGLIHEVMVNPLDGQKRTFKRMIRVDGHVFRTSVHLDTSYANQSQAELAVFIAGVGFSVLMALFGNEVRACREYYNAEPTDREGGRVRGWLHDTDSQLLEIGRQIMRGG